MFVSSTYIRKSIIFTHPYLITHFVKDRIKFFTYTKSNVLNYVLYLLILRLDCSVVYTHYFFPSTEPNGITQIYYYQHLIHDTGIGDKSFHQSLSPFTFCTNFRPFNRTIDNVKKRVKQLSLNMIDGVEKREV